MRPQEPSCLSPFFVSYNEAGELTVILTDIGGRVTSTMYPRFCRKLFNTTFFLPTPSSRVDAVPFNNAVMGGSLQKDLPLPQIAREPRAIEALRAISKMIEQSVCKRTCADGHEFMYATLGPKVFAHVGTNLLPDDAERKFVRDMKAEMELYEQLRNIEDEYPVCVTGRVHALRESTPTYDETKGEVLTRASNGDKEYSQGDQPELSHLLPC